jgi:CubicO group peptidase (beta-lactamase class C family)
MSLREFADKNIFKPLGMKNTHFHNDMAEIVKGRTQAYNPGRRGSFRISIPDFNTYGATSLFTTVEDLALWSQNFVHMKVGGKEVLEKLLKKGLLNSGKTIDYAFGISHGKYKGLNTLGHGGADAGYRSDFQMFPDQNLAIIIFANLGRANPSRLVRQVADIILKDDFPEAPPSKPRAPRKKKRIKRPKLTSEQLSSYAGTYYSEELDTKFIVILKDDKLYLKRRKFRNARMLARDVDIFFSSGNQFRFHKDKNNRISGFTLTTGRVRNLKFVKLK